MNNFFEIGENKKPAIRWKTEPDKRVPAKDAMKFNSVGFALPKGYVVVDCDDEKSTAQVEAFLKGINITTLSYETTRGKHFVFRLPHSEFFSKIGNTIGGTIFMEDQGKSYGSKIDVKGNDKGYVVIKSNGKVRVDAQVVEDFLEKAPLLPVSLAIPKPLKISIYDYLNNGRDNTIFSWLPKLRSKGMVEEDFVRLAIELKVLAKDPESINDTKDWAIQKWNSSVQMGEVVDMTGDSTPEDWYGSDFAFSKKKGDVYLATGINDFKSLSEKIINDYSLCRSYESSQIWAITQKGFGLVDNLDLFVKQIIIEKVGNVTPSLFSNVKQYLEGAIPVREFSKNRFAVTFKNGKVWDVSANREIEIGDKYMNQNVIPHNFVSLDESAYVEEAVILDKAMKGWTKNDKQIEKELYELIGLTLTKFMGIEKTYFLLGVGSNGKSKYLQFLTNIVGQDNVSHEDLKDLSENRFSSANIYGKLANINFDISTSVIENVSMFKKITSGDKISSEFKGQKAFTFAPYATQIFGTNDVPILKESGDSDGAARRIKIIAFNNIFDKKKMTQKEVIEFEKKLYNDRVYELAIIRSLKAINKALNTSFTESQVSKKALEDHERATNHLFDFIEESGIIQGESVKQAFNRYVEWSRENNHRYYTQNNFIKKYANTVRKLYGYTIYKETMTGKTGDRHKIFIEGD